MGRQPISRDDLMPFLIGGPDDMQLLRQRGKELQGLNQLARLADPTHPEMSYEQGRDAFVGGADLYVPAFEADEYRAMLNEQLSDRQGDLYDDFQAMKSGLAPWSQEFNMVDDSQQIQQAQAIAKSFGRVYNPAGGLMGTMEVPPQLSLSVGQPQIESPLNVAQQRLKGGRPGR